jgi:hypothetical protein
MKVNPPKKFKQTVIVFTGSWLMAFVAFAAAKTAAPAEDGDDQAVRRCLHAWGDKQPFGKDKIPPYKILATSVKIMGIGDAVEDKASTKEPRLVLVKPSVAVMSKNVLRLTNPNGWYCLKANVTVMSKTVLELGCNSKVADTRQGVAVLGSNDDGTGHGVTVLGKTTIKRLGCP